MIISYPKSHQQLRPIHNLFIGIDGIRNCVNRLQSVIYLFDDFTIRSIYEKLYLKSHDFVTEVFPLLHAPTTKCWQSVKFLEKLLFVSCLEICVWFLKSFRILQLEWIVISCGHSPKWKFKLILSFSKWCVWSSDNCHSNQEIWMNIFEIHVTFWCFEKKNCWVILH